MDALRRLHQRGWVVGVLALVMAVLFGATIGASFSHSGAAHQLLGQHGHVVSWSSDRPGDDGGQHPLLLHTEGDQVETPDAAGHVAAQFTSLTTPTLLVSLLDDRPCGAHAAPTPLRAELQVWRT